MEATGLDEALLPYAAAEGVISTAGDMARWLRFHLNRGKAGGKTVLSANQMNQLHKGLNIEGQAPESITLYGNGWHIEQSPSGRIHYACGQTEGEACACGFLPYADLGILVAGTRGASRENCMNLLRRIVEFSLSPNLP